LHLRRRRDQLGAMIPDPKTFLSNPALLDEALAGGDIAPLLMVLVHLSGEAEWLDRLAPHIKGPWNFHEAAPDELRAALRVRLRDVLLDYAQSGRPLPAEPPAHLLHRMLSVGVGAEVPAEYLPLIREETVVDAPDPKTVQWRRDVAAARRAAFRTGIIGAGVSGLLMALKLQEAGLPFTIFEKNDAVGGTWYENDYPGCGVDTPNHFYSLSFEPNHDWPEHFSKRDQLWQYLEGIADKYALRPHLHLNTSVVEAHYDEAAALWRVTTRNAEGHEETHEFEALVGAVGTISRPVIPPIPGVEDFAGPLFHTARWDHSIALDGKRVAMIGTGASGMQAGPSIAPKLGHFTIFQRQAHWAVYNANYHAVVSEAKKAALKHIPFYAKWYRFQLLWASADGMHASLHKDPNWDQPAQSLNATNQKLREDIIGYIKTQIGNRTDLLEKVVPPYPPYGKRMLRDNGWYKMLTAPHVELVTTPIARIVKDGVETTDGRHHPADVIIMATGFDGAKALGSFEIFGRDGVSVRELWGDDDPRAFLGITVPRFPNFFMLYGPGTNLAHGGSAMFHSECQVRYIMQAIRELVESGARSIEIREDRCATYNDFLDATHARMVWTHPGVGSWYKNKAGRVVTNSPFRLVDYRRMTENLDPADYLIA
jgi:4-hydroxyacetophenone monooxygenase